MKTILIIEDDITFGMMLQTWLGKKGYTVYSASTISRAKEEIKEHSPALLLSDLRLPDGDGLNLLKWMNETGEVIPLIIMTGYADIQTAVQAIKLGASDYIAKPVNPEELLKKIEDALHNDRLSPTAPVKEKTAKKIPAGTFRESDFIEGKSDPAKQLYSYVGLVAPTNMSVLINGASGTGKEYVAHRIHHSSKRADKPFIAIDCGSIPKELAASEFFGHIKGSFTGALSDKTGAFVAANGGTIFLDEIGNLSYDIQIQLLRALQERRIRPIGSHKEIEVDIRLISATNENLEEAIARGNFREDLYHRINEFTLYIPSLKERREDILLFANFFLDLSNKELGKELIGFDPETTEALLAYSWPGNIRQMKNLIKRATLLAQGRFITLNEIGPEIVTSSRETAELLLHNTQSEMEQIKTALQQVGYNKSKAAKLLGIDRKTLYNKLHQYGIDL